MESTLLQDKLWVALTKDGGWFDGYLILSYFKDCQSALSDPVREDVELLVKNKANCEAVWYYLLALYVYTKCFVNRQKDIKALANQCIMYIKQNQVYKPEVPLNRLKLELKKIY